MGLPWKRGAQDPQIYELQEQLRSIGLLRGPVEAGVLDGTTEEAVRAFQRAAKLKPTGIIDDNTAAYLQAARSGVAPSGETPELAPQRGDRGWLLYTLGGLALGVLLGALLGRD